MLLDLGARLKIAGLRQRRPAAPRYPGGYPDYIVNHERSPGIGPLAGFRGEDGKSYGRGAPNPKQLEPYIADGCFHEHHLAPEQRYYKHANKAYLEWAKDVGFIGAADADRSSSSISSRCRNSAWRRAATARSQPPATHRARIEKYFDPIPFWYPPFDERSERSVNYHSRPSRSGRCTCITRGASHNALAAADHGGEPPLHEPRARADSSASPTATGSGSRARIGRVKGRRCG